MTDDLPPTQPVNTETPPPPDLLNHNIEQAFSGSLESAKNFFELLLESELTVIDRYTKGLATGKISYPSANFPYLAVYHEDKTILPVFSHKERVSAWSEQALQTFTTNFTALSSLIPDNWWIIINLGSDTEKELSPWEISKLRSGKAEIEEIIAEIFRDETGITTEVMELTADEFLEVKNALVEIAEADPRIAKINILKELIKHSSADFEIYEIEKKDVTERLIISVLVDIGSDINSEKITEIEKEISSKIKENISIKLIGNVDFEIAIEDLKTKSAKAALFEGVKPLYEIRSKIHSKTDTSLTSRIKSIFPAFFKNRL